MKYIERFEIPGAGNYGISDDTVNPKSSDFGVWSGGSRIAHQIKSLPRARDYILGHAHASVSGEIDKLISKHAILQDTMKKLDGNDNFELAQFRTEKA